MRLRLMAASLLIASSMCPQMMRAADPAGKSAAGSQFTVSDTTEIPGATLSKGSYSIEIVDQLSDRMILRVAKAGGATKATFIGLPGSNLPASGAGPIAWSAAGKHKEALRGFSFPDGTKVEFVYPKAQAAALAKENSAKVPAIDPVSEGKVSENLSHADMQMVTLWLLSPTTVGPNDATPAIQAQKYQAPSQTQVAGVTATHATKAATNMASVDADTANVRPKRAMTALPHTAGPMPMVWLMGIFSLCGACLLGYRRLARN